MREKLTTQAMQAIQSDANLYAAVSLQLNVKPGSLARILSRQSSRLIEFSVVEIIRKHTGLKHSEIIESKVNPIHNNKNLAGKKRALANTTKH